jgi:hypothetical protein
MLFCCSSVLPHWLRLCLEQIVHTSRASCAPNKSLLPCPFLASRASMGGMVSARALLPFYSGCRVQPSSLATIRAFCCYNTNNNLLVRHLRPLAYSAVMIRDGKQQGWLSLPVDTLPVWAAFNSVAFDGVNIGPLPGKEDRGSTVIAKRSLKGGHEPPLMTIPRDLILSLDRIHEHAKSDSDFRAVLDGLDEFGRVGVVVFLFFFHLTRYPVLRRIYILHTSCSTTTCLLTNSIRSVKVITP